MDYRTLSRQNDGHWITGNPDSGGMGGYFLQAGLIWPWYGGWDMTEPHISAPLSVAAFLASVATPPPPHLTEMVQALRQTHPDTARHLGTQWTADLYGCDGPTLDDPARIETDMLEAARIAHATVLSSRFHRFAPQGVSGVLVIAESHLAIHTWPEQGYAALDVFTCGSTLHAEEAFRWLAGRFGAGAIDVKKVGRGDDAHLQRHPGRGMLR